MMGIQERLAQIKLVVMDIDGTLITGAEPTIDNVIDQLNRLPRAGIRFSLATGRTIHGARSVVSRVFEVPMHRGRLSEKPPIVAYNGGLVAGNFGRRIIGRSDIPLVDQLHLFSVLERHHADALFYTCSIGLTGEPMERVFASPQVAARIPIEFNGMPVIAQAPTPQGFDGLLASLILQTEGVVLERIADDIRHFPGGGLRVTTSGGAFLEVSLAGTTKLSAVNHLATTEGVQLAEVMAIGDNFNDLEMIEGVGFGVAVSNAPAAVKQAAAFTCDLPAAKGVVQILRKLLQAANISRRTI